MLPFKTDLELTDILFRAKKCIKAIQNGRQNQGVYIKVGNSEIMTRRLRKINETKSVNEKNQSG